MLEGLSVAGVTATVSGKSGLAWPARFNWHSALAAGPARAAVLSPRYSSHFRPPPRIPKNRHTLNVNGGGEGAVSSPADGDYR